VNQTLAKLKINKLLLIILATILIVGLGFLIFSCVVKGRRQAMFKTNPVLNSAHRGLSWLITYPNNVADPGILWVVSDINKKYCRSKDIDNFVSNKFLEFKNDPINIAYQRLLNGDDSYRYSETDLQGFSQRFDLYLTIPALYCDKQPTPSAVETQIFATDQTSGYELTHQFIGMLFLEQQGCKNRQTDPVFKSALTATAQKIASEEEGAVFSDIFAERVALLEYAGFANLIQPEWLQDIVNNQQADGSFVDPQASQAEIRVHTTALAVWALTINQAQCPD
jgi:hypothetical protein